VQCNAKLIESGIYQSAFLSWLSNSPIKLSGVLVNKRGYIIIMSIQSAHVEITGINYLLQNNPQTADRFNKYAKILKTKAHHWGGDGLKPENIKSTWQ